MINREFCENFDKLHVRAKMNLLSLNAKKPTIAVVYSQNTTCICDLNLAQTVDKVCDGVFAGGGIAKKVTVSAISDHAIYGGNTSRYQLASRNVIADQVEMIASCDYIDGLVLVGTDNMTLAGMLLGAVRADKPSIFLFGGLSSPLFVHEKETGYQNWYESVALSRMGELNLDEIAKIEHTYPSFCGANCTDYDSVYMPIALEALGLSLSGNNYAVQSSQEKLIQATETGVVAVEMAKQAQNLSKMLNYEAVKVAFAVDCALGGCPDAYLNLSALAYEINNWGDFKLLEGEKWDAFYKKLPLLFDRNVITDTAFCTQLKQVGGVYALVKELCKTDALSGSYLTYNGKNMTDVVRKSTYKECGGFHTAAKPSKSGTCVRSVYGNIAEDGALAFCGGDNNSFSGTAKIYDSEEMLTYAIINREVKAGTVLVVRNEGTMNGLRSMYQPLVLLNTMGLAQEVALITDGRISSCYKGICVGHITPQSLESGVLSVLQDGDKIEINAQKGKISVDLKPRDIAKRKPYVDTTQAHTPRLLKLTGLCCPPTQGCISK